MKTYIAGFAALAIVAAAPAAFAQDTTVVHKESADGEHSKTVIHKEDGSKTVIKKHGDTEKKVHTNADGSKVIVKKTTE